jgi:hypothetical protein
MNNIKIFVDGTRLVFGNHINNPIIALELNDNKTFLAFMKAVSIARSNSKNKTNNLDHLFAESQVNTVDKAEAFVQECIKTMQEAALSVKKD